MPRRRGFASIAARGQGRSRVVATPSFRLALAVTGCVLLACAEESAHEEPSSPPPCVELAEGLTAGDLPGRFVQASGRFLGTKYENGPLGEGEFGGPDPDPRFDFERVDCVTFLEQALALALTGEQAARGFLSTLDAIRYRGGSVSFAARNHHMAVDWIPANSWLLKDVTQEVGHETVRIVRRTIDRAQFLRDQGASPRPGLDDPVTREVAYVPRAAAGDVSPALRSGDLVFWVGRREDIFIAHTGMVVRDGTGGELLFRHASSKAGRVLDESFLAYAAGATFAEGFLVLRLREGAIVPARDSAAGESTFAAGEVKRR